MPRFLSEIPDGGYLQGERRTETLHNRPSDVRDTLGGPVPNTMWTEEERYGRCTRLVGQWVRENHEDDGETRDRGTALRRPLPRSLSTPRGRNGARPKDEVRLDTDLPDYTRVPLSEGVKVR